MIIYYKSITAEILFRILQIFFLGDQPLGDEIPSNKDLTL